LTWANAKPLAGGEVEFSFEYDEDLQDAIPAGVEIALATGPGAAGVDFSSPIETITIAGTTYWSAALASSFDDGATVYLVARVVGVTSSPSAWTVLEPIVADSSGPDANTYIEGAQA
jgi:hypothetical protein